MLKAQINTNGNEVNTTSIVKPFGFLTWWTISQGIYATDQLKQVGLTTGIPAVIHDAITGAEPKTAWLKATQLGSHGKRSEALYKIDHEVHYLTKDVGIEARAIVAQVVDKFGKKIKTSQVATLGRDGDSITAELFNTPELNQDEVVNLIYAMQEEMTNRIGQVDDTRIRSAVLRWLEMAHRVTVRGSGGVYFIPVGKGNSLAETEKEVLAVRSWLDQTGVGTLSVIQLTDDGVTTVTDFRDAAVAEIHAEIQAIYDALTDLEKNTESTPGRLLQSSTVQMTRVVELENKIDALEESLTGIVGVVKGSFATVKYKVNKINAEHHNQMSLIGPGNSSNQSGKKSGATKKGKGRAL